MYKNRICLFIKYYLEMLYKYLELFKPLLLKLGLLLLILKGTYLSYSQGELVTTDKNCSCSDIIIIDSILSHHEATGTSVFLDSTNYKRIIKLEEETGILLGIDWPKKSIDLNSMDLYYLKTRLLLWSIRLKCDYKYNNYPHDSILQVDFSDIIRFINLDNKLHNSSFDYLSSTVSINLLFAKAGNYKIDTNQVKNMQALHKLQDSLYLTILKNPLQRPEILWDRTLDYKYFKKGNVSMRYELIKSISSIELIIHLLSFCDHDSSKTINMLMSSVNYCDVAKEIDTEMFLWFRLFTLVAMKNNHYRMEFYNPDGF